MTKHADRIGKTGGVIAAAGEVAARPTLRLGSISIVQRIVITFQQAGIFPLVVVTGVQADEVRYQLARRGVILLHNEQFAKASLFDSARLGFQYLDGFCGRVVFTPVNSPLVTPSCLWNLLRSKADIARLSHRGRGGHPVALSMRAVDEILRDSRSATLRDAMDAPDLSREWAETDDAGAVLTIHQEKRMREHMAAHRREYIHPHLHICLENEDEVFSPRLKTLLFLVMKTKSVAAACKQVALSVSTAWEMINRLEAALDYAVVIRSRGGAAGSGSALSREGLAFLKSWQRYEESVRSFSTAKFHNLMRRAIR